MFRLIQPKNIHTLLASEQFLVLAVCVGQKKENGKQIKISFLTLLTITYHDLVAHAYPNKCITNVFISSSYGLFSLCSLCVYVFVVVVG